MMFIDPVSLIFSFICFSGSLHKVFVTFNIPEEFDISKSRKTPRTHLNIPMTATTPPPVPQDPASSNHPSSTELPLSHNTDPPSFIDFVTEASSLSSQIDRFLLHPTTLHRPVALVTSGGTAVNIDHVRMLENFSTGWRGARAVEELVQRGYAVVHLWRTGSTAPFTRVLVPSLIPALDVHTLGELLSFLHNDNDEEDSASFPPPDGNTFLTDPPPLQNDPPQDQASSTTTLLRLKRSIAQNSKLQKALEDYHQYRSQILTIPFTYVQDYLGKLQICAQRLEALCSRSTSMIFLAAAVSDFYLPQANAHKIQSHNNNNNKDNNGLTLQLAQVPKMLGHLCRDWARHSFCVSFKLETDPDLLRCKAQQAVERYGVDVVIGNLLHNRYERVSVVKKDGEGGSWSWTELVRRPPSGDDLEGPLIEHVVEEHLEYISRKQTSVGSSAFLFHQQQQHEYRKRQKRQLQRQDFLNRLKRMSMEGLGVVIALCLSYTVNAVFQRRLQQR